MSQSLVVKLLRDRAMAISGAIQDTSEILRDFVPWQR